MKQRATDSGSHLLWSNPHVFQLSLRIAQDQGTTARNLSAGDGNVRFVVRDEVRRDGEFVSPMFDPVFGIAPMTLGQVSDPGERGGFIRLGSANLNVHNS